MLSIRNITIKNFRLFKNISLSFDDDRGLFLFIGKNGTGKSNFLNAICWCLYEEQPFKFHDDEKNLLNEEAFAKNQFDEAKVTIEIEMDNKFYLFQRTKRESQISHLNVMMKKGEDWEPLPNPTTIVNNFLPQSIRKFFLFDGEAIQNLFKGNYAAELKKSILKVSDIELLSRASNNLEKVFRDLQKNISRDEPDMKDCENIISEKERLILEKTEDLKQKETSLVIMENDIKKFRNEQKKYTKYSNLHEKREGFIEQIENAKTRRGDYQKEIINKIIDLSPFLYIKNHLIETNSKINQKINRAEMPPKIKSIFIDELIERKKCICGNKIEKNGKEYKALKKLLNEISPIEDREFLIEDNYEINNILKELNAFPEEIRTLREKRSKEENDIDKLERALKDVREQLKGDPNKKVGDIENTIQKIENETRVIYQDIGSIKNDIIRNTKEKDEQSNKLNKMGQEKNKQALAIKKIKFIQDVIQKNKIIHDRIINRVRKSVSLKTDDYFKNLIWKKNEFQKVEFTDDYEVLVYKNNNENNVLGSLSTGELKVLGFATVKALTELSGFKNVPIFIDGPLEYLDTGVQSDFLKLLPIFMPNKQVFIFSVDRDAIINFGDKKIEKENFYKLIRKNTNSTSVSIVNYYE